MASTRLGRGRDVCSRSFQEHFPPRRAVRNVLLALLALVGVVGVLTASPSVSACPPGNALAGARLTHWLDTTHATSLLMDGAALPEGTRWSSQGVLFTSRASSLTFDLGREATVGALYFQADAAASFVLLVSQDGSNWRTITLGAVPGAAGVRSRTASFDPIAVRYARLGDPSGSQALVTELQLLCDLSSLDVRVLVTDPHPEDALPPLDHAEHAWLRLTGSPWLTPAQTSTLKASLALATALLLAALGASRLRRHRGLRRQGRILLLAAGVCGLFSYYDYGAYRFPNYVHAHEFFHYYVGAKYFRELGYLHLYDCANVADAESGFRKRIDTRWIRDLRTGSLIDAKSVLGTSECRQAFSPERWNTFEDDVAFFRDHSDPASWEHTLRDHGYNPSPVWTTLGSFFANLAPASRATIGYGDSMTTGVLGLVDPALLAVSLVAVVVSFGWEAACVFAVFLGCNPLAGYLWTGGAYARQDWLAASVLGLCALKRGTRTSEYVGGVALAYATLVRIFPGGLLLPIALRGAWTLLREKKCDRHCVRVLAGAVVGGIALVVASSAACGGMKAWADFRENTARLVSTPSENQVGFPTILSFRPSTRAAAIADDSLPDPAAPVRAARRANFAAARPAYLLGLVLLAAALLRVARKTPDLVTLAVAGAASVPILTEFSCYYASILFVLALLAVERRAVAVLLLAACVLLSVLARIVEGDVLYFWSSVVLVVVCAVTVWVCGIAEHSATTAPVIHARAGAALVLVFVLAAFGVCRFTEPLMAKDEACEEAWTALARAGRASGEPRLVGTDFTDALKVAAFVRVQAGLHDADESALARSRSRYDAAVIAFNEALRRAPGAIDRATGIPFAPRIPLGDGAQ